MEVLTITLALILIALLGSGVYVLREVSRNLVPGQRPVSLDEGERAVETALGEVRALATDYQASLARLREQQAEVEAALGRVQGAEQITRHEAEDLLERLRVLGKELEKRLDELNSAEHRELASGNAIAQLAATTDSATRLLTRRAEVMSELYQRLARVEFSIASLTNPVLLPGEPLSLPDDLPPETLQWDNWKDIGESAFALGDYFNLHRHDVDETTARAVEACMRTIRETLTERIYPNLTMPSSNEQRALLRSALEDLIAIPRLRRYLEAQYRPLIGITGTASPDGRGNESPSLAEGPQGEA